jgi:hypothetical protein
MLVRAETLERAGGLESIRGAVIDDCSLARLLKQQDGRLWIGLTDQSQSLRRYESFSDFEHMVSRTAFNQLKHSSLLLLCAVAGTSTVVAHTQQADDLYGRWGHLRAKYCRIET